MKSLASDNYAGAIPEVIEAIQTENRQHAPAYGNDATTKRLEEQFKALFQRPLEMHLTFNGTGANLMGLSCMVHPYSAVLCAETAHIYVDESTAPETLLGCRLIPLNINKAGKLTPTVIEHAIKRQGDLHHPQIHVLSITQPTEYGTVYTLDELKAIKAITQKHKLFLHIDGSRIFTAATSLGCNLKALIDASEADVLSLGGTKAGMLYGEAVLIFNETIHNSPFFHKRSMQLASKNRFIAAQFLALLHHDTWKKYSSTTIKRAKQLAACLSEYPIISITKPVEANAVFAILPQRWIKPLQAILPFYVWDESNDEVRFMCSFDTTEAEINLFDKKLAELSKASIESNL
ncbi:low specificity L-threonine aldolase [Olivibacter ginsenosidimutans]|uniref:Low specificity L-threonine aldolase n=1 Tax=Olivibacter ginsenosidimutans TaxID=1176537 RepID=A0ABP9AP75_9SPHI